MPKSPTPSISSPRVQKTATKRSTKVAPGPSPKSAPEAPTRSSWRRQIDDHSMIQELGLRIRAIRERKGMSLSVVSGLSGLPAATLSRIENSKMSPTFSVLARVMTGLNVDWIDLVGATHLKAGQPVLSFADAKEPVETGVRGLKTVVLHRLVEAHTTSMIAEVKSTKLEDLGGLVGHDGEEFCYVLEGSLALHFKDEAVRVLQKGGSALFDGRIPHAYLAATPKGARFLTVVTRAYGRHSPQAELEVPCPATAPAA